VDKDHFHSAARYEHRDSENDEARISHKRIQFLTRANEPSLHFYVPGIECSLIDRS
jgi:hypothetical protein